jgi:hypothetical protein
MSRLIGAAVLFLVSAGVAGAVVLLPGPTAVPLKAPEIDPASALSALTLLLGGLAVVRGRRVRK